MNTRKINRITGGLLMAGGLALAAGAQAGSWIVQLEEPPAARYMAEQRANGNEPGEDAVQAYREDLAAEQNSFLSSLSDHGVTYTLETAPVPDYDGNVTSVPLRYTLVYNGVALELSDAEADIVRGLDGVASVSRNWMLMPRLADSVEYIHAPDAYGDVHELTQFDDHREGYEGQGMYVSVIDSGIDWTNDMFGGDPTPPRLGLAPEAAAVDTNEKIVYYLPMTDAVEDLFGHGTHVASTAAGYLGFEQGEDGLPATADDVPLHGVAPQAKIMGYQVCSGIGSTAAVFGCPVALTILALEDSVSPRTLNGLPKPVADVINLSLGGAGGPDDSSAVAASNAALAGAVVVAAAGNDGPGERTLGSPSVGRHVISVAASNDKGEFSSSINVLEGIGGGVKPGTPKLVADFAADSNATMGPAQLSGHYVFAGLADTPDQVPLTVAGNICLTVRGSTQDIEAADAGTGLFANKAANCEAKGATAMVMYNDAPGRPGPILAPSGIPVYTISQSGGLLLQDLGYDAAGVSNFPIRINLPDPELFEGTIAGFSSRGPVQGFGQVKPDLSAPGVNVLAAATKTGAPVAALGDPDGYTNSSGTSMATPHAAGAATLVKQAHLDWTPDMVRTAMINTATNPRGRFGTPEADGNGTENVLSQGGGLIDVPEAIGAKALMGVTGDGVNQPGILGSHSFGDVPVVNSRVSHTESVTVTIRDLSGEGGTYDLRVANNRALDEPGISANVAPASVDVPAGGTATFTASVTVNGDVVRTGPRQPQAFIYARRADGAESLRMPLYMFASGSLPAGSGGSQTQNYSGTILAGDQSLGLVEGVTYQDFEIEAPAGTLSIAADLDFAEMVDDTVPDIDMFLYDPEGTEVASSTNPGGPESLDHRVGQFGTYTLRVSGWLNAPTDFDLTVVKETGGEPPVLNAITAEYVNDSGESVDFDGGFVVDWEPAGSNVQRYEVERSVNGGAFEPVAEVDAGDTQYQVTDQANGQYAYRVRALYPGRIGFFVSAPSNEESVIVDRRQKADITADTKTAISNVSFAGGVFEFDLALTNESSQQYVPLVEFNIVSIDSTSGTVAVINADNGGSGTSAEDPALFDYSGELGDEVFSAGETSGTRHLEFRDDASELFTFQAVVTAHQRTGGGTAAGGTAESGNGTEGSDTSGLDSLTRVLEFTVNPLTGTVTTSLIEVL